MCDNLKEKRLYNGPKRLSAGGDGYHRKSIGYIEVRWFSLLDLLEFVLRGACFEYIGDGYRRISVREVGIVFPS